MVGQCFLGSIPPFTASIKTNRAAAVSENELVLPVSAIFAAQLVREFAEIVKKSAGRVGYVASCYHCYQIANDLMAQLIVRNLDEEIVKRLRRRAAESGRSVEAEHREILRQVLLKSRPKKSLKQHLMEMPNIGRDNDFVRTRDQGRKVRL